MKWLLVITILTGDNLISREREYADGRYATLEACLEAGKRVPAPKHGQMEVRCTKNRR